MKALKWLAVCFGTIVMIGNSLFVLKAYQTNQEQEVKQVALTEEIDQLHQEIETLNAELNNVHNLRAKETDERTLEIENLKKEQETLKARLNELQSFLDGNVLNFQ